jgi:hypothetical protein
MTKQGSSVRSSRIFSTIAGSLAVIAAGLVTVMCLGGASPAKNGPAVMTVADRSLAEGLVSASINAYKNYTRGTFSDTVSDDFTPDKYSFVDGVEQSYYSAQPLTVDLFINKVSGGGDTISVDFKWEKKAVLKATGQQQKTSGFCLFVYKKQNETWLLSQVRGSSPF